MCGGVLCCVCVCMWRVWCVSCVLCWCWCLVVVVLCVVCELCVVLVLVFGRGGVVCCVGVVCVSVCV